MHVFDEKKNKFNFFHVPIFGYCPMCLAIWVPRQWTQMLTVPLCEQHMNLPVPSGGSGSWSPQSSAGTSSGPEADWSSRRDSSGPGPVGSHPGKSKQESGSTALKETWSWIRWGFMLVSCLFGPHAHLRRHKKRSKLGRTNPIVATWLFTLQAMSNAWHNKEPGSIFSLCVAHRVQCAWGLGKE